jgi:hypothetical protein
LCGVVSLATATASCDAGKQRNQSFKGPTITILGSNVGNGTPLDPAGVIQFSFDRYLLPSTVTRQSVGILQSSNEPLPIDKAPNVIYDPVARTVTLARPKTGSWLDPGQNYKVKFVIPQNDDDPNGIRAIDNATLEPSQNLVFDFFVAQNDGGVAVAPAGKIPGEPDNVSFCADVLPIFSAKCSAPLCHGSGDKAAMSLILDTSTGVARTAKKRIAQGANTGAIADQPAAPGRVFGVDMPIISVDEGASPPVGDPGNSWLVYKLEMAQSPTADGGANTVSCPSGADAGVQGGQEYRVQAQPARIEPDDFERGALSNLMMGSPMPYPVLPAPHAYAEQPLTFQERQTIRMWIQRGAHIEECGACVAQ